MKTGAPPLVSLTVMEAPVIFAAFSETIVHW